MTEDDHHELVLKPSRLASENYIQAWNEFTLNRMPNTNHILFWDTLLSLLLQLNFLLCNASINS